MAGRDLCTDCGQYRVLCSECDLCKECCECDEEEEEDGDEEQCRDRENVYEGGS